MNTIARASGQMDLLQVAPRFDCVDNATARNAYGMAAQEIACAALGLKPIAINGNYDICFDAERDGHFYEIKSVRNNGKLVLYDWRMKKERVMGMMVDYVIVIHRLKKARLNIADMMLTAGVTILKIPAVTVHAAAAACPLRKPKETDFIQDNPRNGYSRAGYADGYRNTPIEPLTVGITPVCLDFNFYGDWRSVAYLKA